MAGAIAPFARWFARGAGAPVPAAGRPRRGADFPWWGWAGVATAAVAWTISWTSLPAFAPLRPHAFTFLWAGYILSVGGLAWRRSGRCLMTERKAFFAALFPASALFWWVFEYLNRFVQNWHYPGADALGPWEYFLRATLPFSTVLPAVLATRDWLATFPFLERFRDVGAVPARAAGRAAPLVALAASAAALSGLGVFPDALFPFVWVAPPAIVVSLQAIAGRRHVLRGPARGDWTEFVASSLAALVCGFFWEMWNFGSMARWVYAIPYAGRFPLFEMPALGYAGYLPFGILCAAVADLLDPGDGRAAAGPGA